MPWEADWGNAMWVVIDAIERSTHSAAICVTIFIEYIYLKRICRKLRRLEMRKNTYATACWQRDARHLQLGYNKFALRQGPRVALFENYKVSLFMYCFVPESVAKLALAERLLRLEIRELDEHLKPPETVRRRIGNLNDAMHAQIIAIFPAHLIMQSRLYASYSMFALLLTPTTIIYIRWHATTDR